MRSITLLLAAVITIAGLAGVGLGIYHRNSSADAWLAQQAADADRFVAAAKAFK